MIYDDFFTLLFNGKGNFDLIKEYKLTKEFFPFDYHMVFDGIQEYYYTKNKVPSRSYLDSFGVHTEEMDLQVHDFEAVCRKIQVAKRQADIENIFCEAREKIRGTDNVVKDVVLPSIQNLYALIEDEVESRIISGSTILNNLMNYLDPESEALVSTPYPWPTFNKYLKGIFDGTITLIYSMTANMKSWAMFKMIETARKNGKKVLLISPELEEIEVGARSVSLLSHVDFSKIYLKECSGVEYAKVSSIMSMDTLDNISVLFNFTFSKSDFQWLEREVKMHKYDMIFIDSLNVSGIDWKELLKTLEYVKLLARKTGKAVVGTFQANKSWTKDGDKFNAVKETGGTIGWLQYADTVIRTSLKFHGLELQIVKTRQVGYDIKGRVVTLGLDANSFLEEAQENSRTAVRDQSLKVRP